VSYDDDDPPKKKGTPNKDLDKAIKDIIKKAAEGPIDIYLKALNTAISWEKTKHGILTDDDPFDKEEL
jgi:hypothetical protein